MTAGTLPLLDSSHQHPRFHPLRGHRERCSVAADECRRVPGVDVNVRLASCRSEQLE